MALEWGFELAKRCLTGLAFGVRWLASVRNDLLPEEDKDVNPVSLIAKLLIIVAVSLFAFVICINATRWILRWGSQAILTIPLQFRKLEIITRED